jgi:hypothetical protein
MINVRELLAKRSVDICDSTIEVGEVVRSIGTGRVSV